MDKKDGDGMKRIQFGWMITLITTMILILMIDVGMRIIDHREEQDKEDFEEYGKKLELYSEFVKECGKYETLNYAEGGGVSTGGKRHTYFTTYKCGLRRTDEIIHFKKLCDRYNLPIIGGSEREGEPFLIYCGITLNEVNK